MAGLDENGLTIKRLPDILADLQADIRQQYGNDTPVDANSFFGILNTIYGASDAELWELAQVVYNQMNRKTAKGKGLDDIAALLRMSRLDPTKSSGNLTLYGDENTIVPLGTQFSDTNNNFYESTVQGYLDTHLQRVPISFKPTEGSGVSGDLSTTFTIIINGDNYTKQFEWEESAITSIIRDDLVEMIGDQDDYYVTTLSDNDPLYVNDYSTIAGTGSGISTLNIVNKDPNTPLTISVNVIQSPFAGHYSVSQAEIAVEDTVNNYADTVNVEAIETGDIRTAAKTLINIETAVTGLDMVYNYLDMNVGTDYESDEALRARMVEGRYVSGFNTLPSMNAKLLATEGVRGVHINVNKTLAATTELAGKSFECVVSGGTDTDVATTILNNISIEDNSVGNVTVLLEDITGAQRPISFSRTTENYVWSKVTYTLDPETLYPDNGDELIKEAIVAYGESLILGSDINPKKFFGSVYTNVSGIDDLNITFAISTSSVVEPSAPEFSDSTIVVEGTEESIFLIDLIEVIRT